MNHKKRITEICSIEKNISFRDFTLGKINYWPLLRLEMWTTAKIDNKQVVDKVTKVLFIPLYLWKELTQLITFPIRLTTLLLYRKRKFFFETSLSNKVIVNSGRYFDKELDPVLEVLRKEGKYIKIEAIDWLGRTTDDYYPTFYLPLILVGPFIKFRFIFQKKSELDFEKKIHIISKKYKHMIHGHKEVMAMVYYIEYVRKFYILILKIIQPEYVFLRCYYSPKNFGLVAACKELGIKTVDIQHGKQGKIHAMYNHWENTPAGGYKLLPDYFFLWGKESVKNIERSSSKTHLKHHAPILIGNLWASGWINKRYGKLVRPKEKKYLKFIRNYKKRILISLQPIENPLPKFLVKAVNSLPKNTIVLIRLHPSMKDSMKKYKKTLSKKLSCKFEVQEATAIKLYTLLPTIDIHLTAFSSICYEAQLFSVPTIIFNNQGHDMYLNELKKGTFWYAENEERLKDLLREFLNHIPKVKKASYIDVNNRKIKLRLKNFFNRRNPNLN